MTDKPILFSAPMVRQIIKEVKNPGSGKTQTRRVLKCDVPPSPGDDNWLREMFGKPVAAPKHPHAYLDAYAKSREWCWWTRDDRQCMPTFDAGYAPGDRLWVRETWQIVPDHLSECTGPDDIDFAASVDEVKWAITTWRPSIFMPRWASRLTLTVTDVRVEKLQDITEFDATCEGAICAVMDDEGKFYENQSGTYRCGFAGLWRSINGKRAGCDWDDNPWVVAVSFKPELRNIDARKSYDDSPTDPHHGGKIWA